MRRIVLSFENVKGEHEVLFEALAGSCTQLKAAKELTFDSSILRRVPELLRSRFLKAVAAESATEGSTEDSFKNHLSMLAVLTRACCDCVRVAGPQHDMVDLPHPFERQLCLIIRDDTIVGADPERELIGAIFGNNTLRLRAAKALDVECLRDVPAVARERFYDCCKLYQTQQV
jgi:hypothetical protein